jgi:hypothetical protein
MTNDNVASVVPNSKIVNQNFLNWTFRERRTRVSIPIGVASDSDPDLVTETLLRAAEGVQFLLEEPKPTVQFTEFGDSDLKFRLLVWTDKPRRHPVIKSDINYKSHASSARQASRYPTRSATSTCAPAHSASTRAKHCSRRRRRRGRGRGPSLTEVAQSGPRGVG